MRIFLSFFQSQSALPYHAHWPRYIKAGITEGGHEWVEAPDIDWPVGLMPSTREAQKEWRANTWPQALQTITRLHASQPIDLFLSYLFPTQIDTEAIQEIRALGIPCVNFYCDNVRDFTSVPAEFSPFDLHWVPEVEALPMYARAGFPAIWAPMPCWIEPARRTWDHPETHRVTFVGSWDPLRARLFSEAICRGLPLEIYGGGWDASPEFPHLPDNGRRSWGDLLVNQIAFVREQGMPALVHKVWWRIVPESWARIDTSAIRGVVLGNGYQDVLQQSSVTLGVNRFSSYRYPRGRPHTYSRLRDIEAPMLGACYLTEWTPDLDRLYEIGEEVEVYRTPEELTDKARDLLADPGHRRALRRQGQRRALAQHTIPQTLRLIAENLAMEN
jgi:hypothetical protein